MNDTNFEDLNEIKNVQFVSKIGDNNAKTDDRVKVKDDMTIFKKLPSKEIISKSPGPKVSNLRKIPSSGVSSPYLNISRKNNASFVKETSKDLNMTDLSRKRNKSSNVPFPHLAKTERDKKDSNFKRNEESINLVNLDDSMKVLSSIHPSKSPNENYKNLQDSTFDKKKHLERSNSLIDNPRLSSPEHSIKENIDSHLEIITNQKNVNVPLILKEDENKDYLSDSNPFVCRVCYDGETEEKGGLIWPCTCTGSCRYIHESCLKIWIENNFSNCKIRAECEICKHPYAMKFYMKHRYSKLKLCNCIKSLGSVFFVTSIVLTLIFTVIYVVVTALASMSELEKKNFICIVIGIAFGFLIIILIISFKNCRKNFYEPYMSDWKIFNIDGSENMKQAKVEPPIKDENMPQENQIQVVNHNMNRFRVIEHEDSQNGVQGFEIVLNNSGSVMRYDNMPFVNRHNPVVIVDS